MPLLLIPLALGFLGGGATVWAVSDSTKNIAKYAAIAGVAYLAIKYGPAVVKAVKK